jgi:hypothetical protein
MEIAREEKIFDAAVAKIEKKYGARPQPTPTPQSGGWFLRSAGLRRAIIGFAAVLAIGYAAPAPELAPATTPAPVPQANDRAGDTAWYHSRAKMAGFLGRAAHNCPAADADHREWRDLGGSLIDFVRIFYPNETKDWVYEGVDFFDRGVNRFGTGPVCDQTLPDILRAARQADAVDRAK